MGHPLHCKVGKALEAFQGGFEVVRDPACCGETNIPLFLGRRKARETEVCNVDALIIQDDRARVVIEIEESSILPTQVCGKLLTCALAKYYIHETRDNQPIPLEDVLFIQVLDDGDLPDLSKKQRQMALIKDRILAMGLLASKTPITDYKLFWASGLDDNCTSLIAAIRAHWPGGAGVLVKVLPSVTPREPQAIRHARSCSTVRM